MNVDQQTGEVVDNGLPVNPAEVEQNIRELANQVAAGVKIVSERLRKFRDAERHYDLRFAVEYGAYEGPAHMRKYAAEIATSEERKARDDAEVEWKHAERTMRAFETQLSAWQSIGKSVTQMFGAAGA